MYTNSILMKSITNYSLLFIINTSLGELIYHLDLPKLKSIKGSVNGNLIFFGSVEVSGIH